VKIVYIDIDTLRADHLGCYGYERDTSPNIDRLAEEGVRFTRCFASDAPCMPSRAATFSGRYGIKNGVVTNGPLGEVMHGVTRVDTSRPERGYAPMLQAWLAVNHIPTISFSPFGRHPAPWFFQGWSEQHQLRQDVWMQHIWGEDVNREVLPWLEAHAHEDFFLHVNYWDPHIIYEKPLEYALRFLGKGGLPDWPDEETIARQYQVGTLFTAAWFDIRDRSDLDRYISTYDGEIFYADQQVGQLLAKLEELGILDDTLIILNADHGEQFGEGNTYCDHTGIYDAVIHVPLIIRYPKRFPAGETRDEFVYNLDLGPTLCEFAGLPTPPGWDGRSWIPIIEGREENPREYIVSGKGLYRAQRCVRTVKWKYVRTYHAGFWDDPPEVLYDLDADPYETTNVADKYPMITWQLRALLTDFERQKGALEPDPMLVTAEQGPWGWDISKARRPRWMTWPGLPPRPGEDRLRPPDEVWLYNLRRRILAK